MLLPIRIYHYELRSNSDVVVEIKTQIDRKQHIKKAVMDIACARRRYIFIFALFV